MNFWTNALAAAALLALPLAAQQKSLLDREPAGWTDVMPGPKLEGWTRLKIRDTAEDSARQWQRHGDILLCAGDGGHDWIRYDTPFENFVFHVEFRFTPLEGNPRYNSGIFVRNTADYSRWYQAQTGPAGGFLFGIGEEAGQPKRFNLREQLKEDRMAAPGEWNTFEVTANGRALSVWANGAVVSEWNDCPVPKGHIGLEGEGFRIEFRNLKVKRLP